MHGHQVGILAACKVFAQNFQRNTGGSEVVLKHLAEKELVNYAPYDVVTLTAAGKKIAREIQRKHKALFGFFTNVLDIDTQEAEDFACKMEHSIPEHVLERFIGFSEFVQRCPNSGAVWQGKAKGYFCREQAGGSPLCQDCKLDSLLSPPSSCDST